MCLIYCDYLIQHIFYKNTISLETKINCKLESDAFLKIIEICIKNMQLCQKVSLWPSFSVFGVSASEL